MTRRGARPGVTRSRWLLLPVAIGGLSLLSGAQGVVADAGPADAVPVVASGPAGPSLPGPIADRPAPAPSSAGAVAGVAATASSSGPYGVASTSGLTSSGIPRAALEAYALAAARLAVTDPACRVSWSLIAGIGRVESNHGRFAGSTVGDDGIVRPAILGIRLDGTRPGTARIGDSDGGRYDGDTAFDRAVGPMQFLPGTWKAYGSGNPQDIRAAALATGKYLCSGSGDLSTEKGRWASVYRYNRSDSYVSLVLSLADSYARGGAPAPFPSRPAGAVAGGGSATTPGRPPAVAADPPKPAEPSKPAPAKPSRPEPAPSSPAPSSPAPSSPAPTPSPTPTPSSPAPTPSPTPSPAPSSPAPPDGTAAAPLPLEFGTIATVPVTKPGRPVVYAFTWDGKGSLAWIIDEQLPSGQLAVASPAGEVTGMGFGPDRRAGHLVPASGGSGTWTLTVDPAGDATGTAHIVISPEDQPQS